MTKFGMISLNLPDSPIPSLEGILLDKFITVKAVGEVTGYSAQYLRWLQRAGKLYGVKIGQVWLISLASLEAYLKRCQRVRDQRHGRIRVTRSVKSR